MKILLVNKYLYRKGGAETYFIKLGEYLKSLGNEVEYFGMADERNCVENRVEAYTENIDFHKKSLKYITYPFKIIYSVNARKQIRKVLSNFKPDVVHLNNFNYQLTPSIIYEIKKHNIPIVYTAHDVQLVCPNHKLKNDYTDGLCRKCDGGKYFECVKNNCVHSSKIRSILGAVEAWYYKLRHTYKMIDLTVCPSEFMEKEINRLLRWLQGEFILAWMLVLLLIALYETDVLPQGMMVGDVRMEYILQTAGILLAMGLIPVSLRLFSLSLTRYVKTMPLPEALKSYRRWSEVRLGLLLAPALFNLSVYYWTLDLTGMLCAGMLLVASLFCVPGRERLLMELDLNREEGEKEE